MGEAPRDASDLLKVSWDGSAFWMRSDSGYERESTVTDTEDVSYVSSPYLPNCLRHGGRESVSNADKAHLSAAGATLPTCKIVRSVSQVRQIFVTSCPKFWFSMMLIS